MRIIDMHCDTLLEGWKHSHADLLDADLSVNFNMLKENDSLLQFFAIFMDNRLIGDDDPYELLKGVHGYYAEQMEKHGDVIRPALSAGDVEENRKAGLLSSMLTVEDGAFIDGRSERLKAAYDMGVRLVTLTWNYENCLGFPNSDDPAKNAKGLKPFGIEMVEQMNEMGMIVDVSHLSEGGFYDVAKYSKKPFVASHSCAKTLCGHRRNLTDDQLRLIGETGSVVGVNFAGFFLRDNAEAPMIDWVNEHLLYMKDKAGIDALAFGSDFDGIGDNGEFVNYGGFGRLLAKMEKHFTDDEIDKIAFGNVTRLMKDVLK